MKTIITAVVLILLMYAANAQKARIGLTAGSALSNYRVKAGGEDQTADSRLGFTAGIIANLPAGKNFMIQTGANWVQKGSEYEEDFGKVALTVSSIEIPVNFMYTSKGGFFAGAGPSASFAVSGKLKANDVSEKLNIGSSEDDNIRGFDFGANVVTGYQFQSGLMIAANFNQGFSNLMPGSSDNGSVKSHYFGIRLGYVLKGKKS